MPIVTYVPRPPLSEFVALFWCQRATGICRQERALPTGTVELVVNLTNAALQVYGMRNPGAPQRFDGGMICGPHSESFIIDSTADESVIGVHFKPGGAFPFLGIPSDELHNRHVSLETLWGLKARSLRTKLVEAPSDAKRFARLERFLLWRAHNTLLLDRRIAHSLRRLRAAADPIKVSTLAEEMGLSHRGFVQLFRTTVGLTPKQYHRIQRFQHALHELKQGTEVRWTDVAVACGYYDQAHFNHDFRAFAGITPGEYRRSRTDRLNHVLFYG